MKLKLLSLVVDNVKGARDRLSWGGCSNGKFTVKSAYSFLSLDWSSKQQMARFFSRIWRVVAHERVRVFIWLAANQVLMTNVERYRRHLCDSSLCSVCKSGEETILHILRDCPAMAGIWTRLLPARRLSSFFSKSLLEWIYANLGEEIEINGCPWAVTFSQAIWWGWKWRCGNIFGENRKCRDRVRFIKDRALDVWKAHVHKMGVTTRTAREERLIAWSPPRVGWFKLNTDGASRGNPGLATAGGVVRDGDGNWCYGFSLNIGICSAPLAELWGAYYGLNIAWERGVTQLEMEIDSEMVVGFLRTGIDDSHPLSFLVRLCHGLLSKDWSVRISHVYREANRLADGLANYAFLLPLGFHLFNSTPDSVMSIVHDDVAGSAYPRNVQV